MTMTRWLRRARSLSEQPLCQKFSIIYRSRKQYVFDANNLVILYQVTPVI